MKKKLLSLLMALCLVVTLLPVSALAADDSADAAADLIEGSAEESAESLMEVPAATASETVVKGNNSGSNQPVNSESIFNGTTAIAEVGGQQYSTLQEALNAAASSENKTITILVSGEYVPFTVNQVGVNVCAKDGVDVTIKTNKTTKMAVTANNVTLKGLNFVSTDGTAVISGGSCDGLTLEKCSFTGNGATDSIALYIHQPNITITGCTFENFERGYYTCGDNHAAGNMVFEGNTFTNVRVPIDGYWGMPATNNTNIQVTDNKIDAGSWGTAYIQLWDYAQLAKWADFVHQGEKLNPDGKTALKGMVSGNSATGGELVLYATHCNWYSNSEIQWKGQQPVYRNMIFLENVTKENEVTVTHKDGSPITAFNESTGKKEVAKKYVIYTLSEGEYKVNVTQKQENGDSVVTEYDLTVVPTEHDPTGGNTQKIKVTPLDGENNTVAVVGNVPYTSLAAAVEAAKNGGTVELLQNVTIDTWNQVWDTDGLTIKGNNHTVTVNNVESGANGNYLFYGAKNLNVSDLTIKFTTNGSGFSMVSGKLEGVTVNGGVYAVATGAAPAGQKVEIKNCTFTGQSEMAIYTQENGNAANTVIDGCTFNSERAVILRNNEQFTNNTVKGSAGVTIYSNATATVTGNTFTEGSRLKVYNTKSTIERNKLLGNVVLDDTVPTDSEVSLDKNYWGEGRTPSSVLSNDASKVDGGKTEYYVRPSMNPEDLNTYVPPVIDNGGSYEPSGDYVVSVDKTVGGKVTVNPGRADKGDTVTITVKPDKGYELDSLIVTAKDGGAVKLTEKSANKFTFKMPGSKVTVEAVFVKEDTKPVVTLPFADVNKGDWFYDAVEYVYSHDLMNGTSAAAFSPYLTTSRAMMLTMLARYDGVDTSTGSTWYEAGAVWAIAEGVSDGTNLEANLTREQLVTMLWRYAGSPVVESDLSGYPDGAAVSDWALNAMIWATGEGVITGNGAGALNPQGTATRAEVATILMRFIEN